jgi:hypothetical protein
VRRIFTGTLRRPGAARNVLGREQGRARKRPFDSDLGIAPQDAALVLGSVEICGLVDDLGEVAEHEESVGESDRNPQHVLGFRAQVCSLPPAEGRRAAADIDRDVEDLARGDANQLALRQAQLVVQPAQHTLARARVVVLDEPRPDSRLLEFPLVPALEEKAARVAEDFRLDE